MNPAENDEIYRYYESRYEKDAKAPPPSNSQDGIHQILLADASDEQTDPDSVDPWMRKKEPIGEGAYAAVWLWEKYRRPYSNDALLQLAVKDAKLDRFWKDHPSEGILLRKLHDHGCKTVITVYDWMFKEATQLGEPSIIRIIEEFAEHGDLLDISNFYAENKLIIPEAFLWHIFWSGANTLCYCRHGTTQSPETIDGWDPITHMDIKPENFLMTKPDDSLNEHYPAIKMGDFGFAYTLPAVGNDRFRGWKSTWTYGTRGFQAPEVQHLIRPKEGSFDPVQLAALHGSHSDIYSLGRTMLDLRSRSIAGAHADKHDNEDQHVNDYYSKPLNDLIVWCLERPIRRRPSVYQLFQKTTEGMEMHQRIMRKEQAEAEDGWPFHSQVLYTKASQLRYARDPVFTVMYEKVNHAPLKDGVKTVDPSEQPTPSVQTPERQTPNPPPGNPNQRGRVPSATGRASNPRTTTPPINASDDEPLSLNTNAANVCTKKIVKPRNLISHIDVPPPTPSLPYTARTKVPRGRSPKKAPTPTPSLRKQPPRQVKAAKLDKPKPAQGKSKAKPATQTIPRPRGRPPKKPATKRGPKSPPKATPKASAQPKAPPKTHSQPSKQLTKVSKRTTTPRNPNAPPPTQIIETTHVRLRKPYPASIREPPFLPGRPAPVPQITIASAPTTDKGGSKRKSDDGITTRSGKRVRFNVGRGREEEEEEDGEEEVIDVSSGSEDEDEDSNEDGAVEVEPPAQTRARTRAGAERKGKIIAKTVQLKGKGKGKGRR